MSRALGLALLTAAVAVTALHVPNAFRRIEAETDAAASLSREQRELVPARSVDLDARVLEEARATIPPDATYAVVTGERVQVSNQVTFDAIRPLAAYWLLPRRQVADPANADWVLAFGGDLDALGIPHRPVAEPMEGVVIAEVGG